MEFVGNTYTSVKIVSPQVGGDSDTQLVIDKTTSQLKCLLEQLVNLVQQDDHVTQSDNDTAKVKHVIIAAAIVYTCVLTEQIM